MLGKLADITTNINVATAENGDIEANFYTEDDGNAYIRIAITDNGVPFDFKTSDMKPRLDLFCEDTSIFTNEPLDILLADKGVIQYKLSDNVIKHAGRVDAKLFLSNKTDSLHVANFFFTIRDSGLTGPIGKEVQIDTLNSIVTDVMSKNAIGIIDDDFKNRLFEDAEAKLEKNINYKEVVDARGNSANLKERLDNQSTELEFGIKKLKEKSFYNFLTQNSVNTPNNTVSISSDRNLNFNLRYNDTDVIKLNFGKDLNDDFIKFKNADYVGQVTSSSAQTVTDNFAQSMVSDGTVTGSGDNWYTTTIGTKVNYTFTGSSITLRIYTDARGGMWKASVDGAFVKNISTNTGAYDTSSSLVASVYEINIANGMDNKQHTLTLEFLGQDDKYPTSSPRGWLRMKTATSKVGYDFDTFVYVVKGATVTKTQNVLWDSNKEFAFSVDFGDRTEWIPEHNSTGTLKLSDKGKQTLVIDNKEVDMTKSLGEMPFTEVKILQNLFGVHPTTSEKYCEFVIVTTITSRGVKFNTKVTWLKETNVSSGYVNMFTINPNFADTLVTSYNTTYNLSVYDGSYQYLQEEAPYSYAAISSKFPNMYLTCDNLNAYNTLRMGYSDRDGDEYGNGLFALQHRNTDLQKLYPKVYTNHKTKAGEQYTFEGYFGFGRLPMANRILGN